MKKYAIVLAIFLISGCQNTDEPISVKTGQADVSSDRPSSEAVVDRLGQIENFERFEEFLMNTEKGVKDKLTIVQYTTEGDPIFQELDYDGTVIKSTTDTSQDKFGSGEIYKKTCTSIEVTEKTDVTEYVLTGCDESEDITLFIMEE